MGVDAPYNNITRNRRDHTDLDLALLREITGTKTERKGIEFCIPKYTHLRCDNQRPDTDLRTSNQSALATQVNAPRLRETFRL